MCRRLLLLALIVAAGGPAPAASSPAVGSPATPRPAQSSALDVVRAQLDAYNRHDADAFLATYDDRATLLDLRSGRAQATGKASFGPLYRDQFSSGCMGTLGVECPDLGVEVVATLTLDRFVVVHERIVLTAGEPGIEGIVLYEVREGRIWRVWFGWHQGEPVADPAVVDAQIAAYNAKNLDAFAGAYAEQVELFRITTGELLGRGRSMLRASYEARFRDRPDLRVRVDGRIGVGDLVVTAEEVSGTSGEPARSLDIYQVLDGQIRRSWFVIPEAGAVPWLPSPSAIDHAFAILLVLVLPLYARRAYLRLIAGLSDRDRGQLMRTYRRTVVRQNVLGVVLLSTWVAQGRRLVDLGLGLRPSLGFAVGLGLALLMIAYGVAQARRVARDEALRARVRERFAASSVSALVPRTDDELRIFLAVAVSAGVWEELLYRGFLVAYASWALGPLGGVLAAAAAFGLGHLYQGAGGVAKTTVAGLVAGGLLLLTGSLFVPMLLHAAIDVHAGVLGRLALGDRAA